MISSSQYCDLLDQGGDHSTADTNRMNSNITNHKPDIDHSLQKLTIDHKLHNPDTNTI